MSSPPIEELFIWFPAFLLSITFHEAAHAATSLFYGDKTAQHQASLNPIPHIQQEPIGTLVAPVLSFFWLGWCLGWASAPYDPYWADRHPRRAALMSAAGPLSNLLLAGLSLAAIRILMATDVIGINPVAGTIPNWLIASNDSLSFLAQFLSVMFVLNLILGFFNLIPLPPLDGSGILRGLFPGSAPARFLATMEERGWAMIGLLLAWMLFPRIFPVIIIIIRFGLGIEG